MLAERVRDRLASIFVWLATNAPHSTGRAFPQYGEEVRMASSGISRRVLVGLLGSGVLAAPSIAQALGKVAKTPSDAPSPSPCDPAKLLRPLAVGARFGRWTVKAIEPLQRGAVTVALASDDAPERVFHVEILTRDPSPIAAHPPAETRSFALFVKNGGDGYAPTHENEGLCAMALAQIVAANEAEIDARGFLTHAERIALHREELVVVEAPPGASVSASNRPRWQR